MEERGRDARALQARGMGLVLERSTHLMGQTDARSASSPVCREGAAGAPDTGRSGEVERRFARTSEPRPDSVGRPSRGKLQKIRVSNQAWTVQEHHDVLGNVDELAAKVQ